MAEEEQDKSNQLRVVSFEPHLVQIEIVDFKQWKEENTDSDIKIGSFLKIEDGNEKNILVLVQSFKMKPKHEDNGEATEEDQYLGTFIINTQPIGQLEKQLDESFKFIKGIKNISIPPNGVSIASDEEIKNIFSVDEEARLVFSEHLVNPDIKIEIDGDKFFSKHIAVVGSTGSGKSCTVAKIIQEAKKLKESQQLNNTHIIIFDIHGEYEKAFPEANVLSIEHNSLKLPYWLMNSEELEDMFIESNENNSHNQVSQFKHTVIMNKKKHNSNVQVTYDSPIYFSITEVKNYITNRNNEVINKIAGQEQKPKLSDGELINDENRYFNEIFTFAPTSTAAATKASSGTFNGEFNRFISRLETKLNDDRLNFLLYPMKTETEVYKTDDLKILVEQLLGYVDGNKNITIVDLSSLPFEVVSIVVSIVSRIVFDFAYYSTKNASGDSKNETPFMLVYEEAHKYIPKNAEARYKNTRLAVERIAKEGRKYGVSSMIVSQRPSEISSTVFSQCNNFVVMRLNNPDDQSYVKRLLPEAVVSYGDALSSLEKREALIVGDSIATPTIGKVLDANPTPRSEDIDFYTEWKYDWKNMAFDDIIKSINKDIE
ncbi:MAG: DNA helicase HerA-like ATPase [Sulfurimonas sp.]|jgi:DNA helicase HerA-like ATPase|uniref:ATP-binding protein n=1 Tax=Sulfurimonas sp. TaxID=2022749 RepID=UPI0039E65916